MIEPGAGQIGAMGNAATSFNAFLPGPRLRLGATGEGPLNGLDFAVKDLIDVAGSVTGGGNPDWRRSHPPAERHAPVVASLLAAGAALVGKTITDELAFSLEGDNAHYGTPVNPRCPGRLPGGSSSGSAVAVATGQADFALGTDTGGSVRVPASFCGLYGFRPSHGRIPVDGVLPFAPSYDSIGWFARDGVTLAKVGQVLLGNVTASVPRRLLLARDAFDFCEPAAADALFANATRLGIADGVQLFDGQAAMWLETYRVLQNFEIWATLGRSIERLRPTFGDNIAPRFAEAAAISAAQAAKHRPLRQAICDRLHRLLEAGTALLLPTAPGIAPYRGLAGAELGEFYRRALTLSCPAGHAGLPQVSLPAVTVEGCPVGLSIIGPRGSDAALLVLAASTAFKA